MRVQGSRYEAPRRGPGEGQSKKGVTHMDLLLLLLLGGLILWGTGHLIVR